MVNFNDNNTISKPPTEIINMVVIEAWYNWRLAYEQYLLYKYQRKGELLQETRARTVTLFLTCHELLKRKLKAPDEFDTLKYICMNSIIESEILNAYLTINNVLDEANLIKIDTKPVLDRTDTEAMNTHYGY